MHAGSILTTQHKGSHRTTYHPICNDWLIDGMEPRNPCLRGLVKTSQSCAGFIQVLQDKIQGLFQDFSRTTKIFFKYFYAQMRLLIFNVLRRKVRDFSVMFGMTGQSQALYNAPGMYRYWFCPISVSVIDLPWRSFGNTRNTANIDRLCVFHRA